ncbi:hypothetical protein E2C01_074641 [Portunus trituberculatus]|uniref:Uncharacterized protein n=1 Tax=Portunus trituberculatus TaxID=210409 RepID=A0A5B7IDN9_PORTR|nr:hypothetical protein [Portunus trituberculatus]
MAVLVVARWGGVRVQEMRERCMQQMKGGCLQEDVQCSSDRLPITTSLQQPRRHLQGGRRRFRQRPRCSETRGSGGRKARGPRRPG